MAGAGDEGGGVVKREVARGGQREADATEDGTPKGEDRDFGNSAGYGHGGSALDYHEVMGEDAPPLEGPNPLDEVVKTGGGKGGDRA